jgi:hypothetical protein
MEARGFFLSYVVEFVYKIDRKICQALGRISGSMNLARPFKAGL